MIFEIPTPDSRELEVIRQIDDSQRELGYSLTRLPKKWTGQLRRNAFARNSRASNSIEGIHISLEDAIAAIDGAEPLDAQPEDWEAHTCYQSAMTYVLQLADDEHFGYSVDLIRSLHFMLQKYDTTKRPGRWRSGAIGVVDTRTQTQVYEAPPVEMVPALMDELVASLRADDGTPALVRAAMVHLNLAMIHPFSDGNGRMARCLQSLMLARSSEIAYPFLSIEERLGKNTPAYYDALGAVGGEHWSPRSDARSWVRFCLKAHYFQSRTHLRRARQQARILDALDEILAPTSLHERVKFALSDAAIGLKVRNSSYRQVAGISDQVASRDLGKLVELGLLIPRGEKRGRTYEASEEIRQLSRRGAEPKAIADPFEIEASGATSSATVSDSFSGTGMEPLA